VFAQNAIGFWSASAPSYPACIDDGHHWWYDPTDLTQVTKDGSNLVSSIQTKGIVGRPLLQANDSKKPLWVEGGTIRFDGVDDFIKTASFTWNQPCFVYMTVKQITHTHLDRFINGSIGGNGIIQQISPSPRIRAVAGTASTATSDLTIDTWGIIRVLFYGANSKLQVNNNIPIIGDFGSENLSGLTIGSSSIGGNSSNIEVKDIICCDTTDVANETEIYNWLVTRKP
jgi:hypothetical protein